MEHIIDCFDAGEVPRIFFEAFAEFHSEQLTKLDKFEELKDDCPALYLQIMRHRCRILEKKIESDAAIVSRNIQTGAKHLLRTNIEAPAVEEQFLKENFRVLRESARKN